MLEVLKIKNVALIDNLTINFKNGLNVLTGETGAGKSIIIDSINFLLGARADKTLIRYGEEFARVDGVFSVDLTQENIVNFFNEIGVEIEDTLIISRTMSVLGKNEIRVNGQPVTLFMLKTLTANLVDVYGQNDQIFLNSSKKQLEILDNFSTDVLNGLNEYSCLMADLKQVNAKINSFGGNDDLREREIDLLKYQIDEIKRANLTESEEIDLIQDRKIAINFEKISSLSIQLENNLVSANDFVSLAKQNANGCSGYEDRFSNLFDRIESLSIELEDLKEEVADYNQNINSNDFDLDSIENRLDVYKSFKRKYGDSVEKINQFLNESEQRLNLLENSDFEIQKLEKNKKEILGKLFDIANKITNLRKEQASLLEKQIIGNLKLLGMQNAKVCFKFEDYERNEQSLMFNGCDKVELLFSANKGEELKKLKDIASGGEMSRFMLAIKSITAEKDNIPTMIFDEIDTGISGAMAQAVAEQMVKIAKAHQVFAITHTVQIASMADYNYLVKKQEINDRTISSVKELDEQEKLNEIARFFSSTNISDSAIKSAKDLIESQRRYKLKLNNN